MADPPAPPIKPSCAYHFIDPNFPLVCDVDYEKAYCCQPSPEFDTGNFVECTDGTCLVGFPFGGGQFMSFPEENSEGAPMLKTALGGTTMSAWARIAFQQYCGDDEYPPSTAETIVTMGNISQPCNPEQCKAVIKTFQYGWGTTDQGNRVRVTIMDQKGSEFQEWVQRMGINPEADSTPIQGKYRMKVQWGWYVTGGAPEDICGQPPQDLGDPGCGLNDGFLTDTGHLIPKAPPPPGFNSAFIICSPVLYFLTDWVNAHYEQGKFIYEVEGTDTLVRGQEQMIQQVFGTDQKEIYFTKAVELLGRVSFPQFRVEFKALDKNGDVVDMEFVTPDNDTKCREFSDDGFADCLGYGPLKVFYPNTKPPLAIIHEWLNQGVLARDLTGKVTSNKMRVGITMNYDPSYKFIPNGQPGGTNDPCAVCSSDQPQYGRLILWANAIPYCQSNYNDAEINKRLKAVYIVNGGNCSPVLSFAPSFRWHVAAAQRTAGNTTPIVGTNVDTRQGYFRANCPIASSPGYTRMATVTATQETSKTRSPSLQTQESTFHHIMANLGIGAIEADLRVQGDPAFFLCSPIEGMGRCVGIVFVNPFFLEDDPNNPVKGCPGWLAGDPDEENADLKASINKLLTNKGWFIFGVDHQIKDGQYITTLKLKLVAPAAELNQAGSITNLGAWDGSSPDEGTPVPYGGRFGCLDKVVSGNAGVSWGNQPGTPHSACGLFVGGGTACSENYLVVPGGDLPPD
jgi:hypothetical protein